ncbi:MAG: pyridoxamine 5'-phosphate oxidase family protein [Pirellulales bacterium]|nr:pyridoxamine 5'-phosphate oxidase family protein [Pirellulales bacterium]
MGLQEYFEGAKGIGVLATADAEGKVNVAVYARPHFLGDDEAEVAFIMNDRLSHDNVVSNPQAAYLFVEEAPGYVGKRLFLTKTREETDQDKIQSIRQRDLPPECEEEDAQKRFLVHFRVDGIRPLIGPGE